MSVPWQRLRCLPLLLCGWLPLAQADDLLACAATARRIITELTPHAEFIAGRALQIVPPQSVVLFWIPAGGIAEAKVAAHAFGRHIHVHPEFCRREEAVQWAILAHEIGHVIDSESGQLPPRVAAERWAERGGEISATRHALAIFRRAGRDTAAFAAEFPAAHLTQAERPR